jgi:hypothetical protein
MSVQVTERRRGNRSGRGQVLALAGIPVMLGAAAGVAFVAASGGTTSASSPPQAGTRPATASPPGDGRVPAPAASTPPQTAGWRDTTVDGAPVPESASDGPSKLTSSTASGFTDTESGAVLAAVNITVRTSGQLGPAVFSPTITSQVTGEWQETLMGAAWQEYQESGSQSADGAPSAKATMTVTGFKIGSWSPGSAAVTLAVDADSARYEEVTVPVKLTWTGGDWRLVAPASGQYAATPAAAPSCGAPVPRGFTALPAVRAMASAACAGGKSR